MFDRVSDRFSDLFSRFSNRFSCRVQNFRGQFRSVGLWKREAATGPESRNDLFDSKESKKRLFPLSTKRLKSDQKETF